MTLHQFIIPSSKKYATLVDYDRQNTLITIVIYYFMLWCCSIFGEKDVCGSSRCGRRTCSVAVTRGRVHLRRRLTVMGFNINFNLLTSAHPYVHTYNCASIYIYIARACVRACVCCVCVCVCVYYVFDVCLCLYQYTSNVNNTTKNY